MGDLPGWLVAARQQSQRNAPAWQGTPQNAPGYRPPRPMPRVMRPAEQRMYDPNAGVRAQAIRQLRAQQDMRQNSFADTTMRGAFSEPRDQIREAGGMAAEMTGAPQLARGIRHLGNGEPGEALPELALGGLNALGMATMPFNGGGARGALRAPRDLPSRLRVYHGSPHQFEQFDPSRIGTGEGAQAYGHGLYVAQADDVGQAYRQQLSGSDGGHLYEGYLSGRPSEFIDLDTPVHRQPQQVQDFVSQLYDMPVQEMRRRGLKPVIIGEDEARRAQEAGFAGLRYLDEGSRASGGGTRNYVVFDPSRVDWDVRNGALTRPTGDAADAFRFEDGAPVAANAQSPELPPPRLPNAPPRIPTRATDGSILPARQPEPFRNSLRGGSDDLAEAARSGPDAGPVQMRIYRGVTGGDTRTGRYWTSDPQYASRQATGQGATDGLAVMSADAEFANPYRTQNALESSYLEAPEIGGGERWIESVRARGHDAIIDEHGNQIYVLDESRVTPAFGRPAPDARPVQGGVDPLRVYHGTTEEFAPEQIRPWSHFGTENAARQRLEALVEPQYRGAENGPPMRVLPYEITGRRINVGAEPLGSGDITLNQISDMLRSGGHITPEEHAWVMASSGREEALTRLSDLAERHDIGAIGYRNSIEDAGSQSYIVPNPSRNIRVAEEEAAPYGWIMRDGVRRPSPPPLNARNTAPDGGPVQAGNRPWSIRTASTPGSPHVLEAVDQNGRVVGALDVAHAEGPWAEGSGPYARGVFVEPDFRRQGVATDLYREAERRFGRMVPSEAQNDSARAFWESYRPTRTGPNAGPPQRPRPIFPGSNR